MDRERHVTWSSKTRLSELEGYILSVYVRIHASGLKNMHDRQMLPPTVLTPEIAEAMIGPYSYAMDAVFRGEIRSIRDMDDYMTRPGSDDKVLAWMDENDEKIEKARKRLAELTGDFRCIG